MRQKRIKGNENINHINYDIDLLDYHRSHLDHRNPGCLLRIHEEVGKPNLGEDLLQHHLASSHPPIHHPLHPQQADLI